MKKKKKVKNKQFRYTVENKNLENRVLHPFNLFFSFKSLFTKLESTRYNVYKVMNHR